MTGFARPLLALLSVATLFGVAPALSAQDAPPPAAFGPDSLLRMLSGTQRTKTTRADLEASLREIDEILASKGYSAALKASRRAEADLIRRRLGEGDIFPGDVILLQVSGDPRMTGVYGVTPKRTIQVPGAGELTVANLLRSELEPHLATELAKYVRNPTVRAEPLLRLQISGSVNRPGFYTVPSSIPIPDVLMQFAGGPSPAADLQRSTVRRGGDVVLPGAALDEAAREARSLDALNLKAGDELRIESRPSGSGVGRALAVLGSLGSIGFLLVQVF